MANRLPRLIIYTEDTGPPLVFNIKKTDGSGSQDLTGASAKCLIRLQGKNTNLFTGTSTDCVITDAINGKVKYTLPSAITDPGVYTGQIRIDFGSGVLQRTERFELEVVEGLSAT